MAAEHGSRAHTACLSACLSACLPACQALEAALEREKTKVPVVSRGNDNDGEPKLLSGAELNESNETEHLPV